MRVYQLAHPDQLRPRAHPWVASEADPTHRYYDFVQQPELIRSSLEDLQAWHGTAWAETFFQLIEWLNGPDSSLMSNDCAFNAPAPHDGTHSERRLEASGRLMVLFRNLAINTKAARVSALMQRVGGILSETDPGLEEAAVGVSIVDVQFATMRRSPKRQLGQQLMLSFWAWGDDEAQTLLNLDRTLVNLGTALRAP